MDKSVLGQETKEFVWEIEKGKIGDFADAIADDNPAYYDEDHHVENSALRGIVAPLTFGTRLNFIRGAERIDLKLDWHKVLHGEQQFEYFKPVRPGDKLYCKTKIVDIYEKSGRSGTMTFAVAETTCRDKNGEIVLIARGTTIERS